MEVSESQAANDLPKELMEGAIDISPNQDGGVYKIVLTESSIDEKAAQGDTVYVHYVGTLLDGTKFDSSRDRGDKFSFKLGEGQVIKAWDIGVATMKRGELCKLICRADYAYGESGSPPTIPPNATLVFEVELFDWKGEDLSQNKDGGIIRSVLLKGEGNTHPNEGALVEVSLKGSYEGKVFEERDVSFTVGDGNEVGVVEGIDHAIKKFKKLETSLLTFTPRYAFGEDGCAEKGIPGGAIIKYEVTLKGFEKAKEGYEMEPNEKLEQSEIAKNKGTNFFKANEFKQAIKKYKKVIDWLSDSSDFAEEEQLTKRKSLTLAAHLNSALCHIKMEDWPKAKQQCDSALELDSNSEKALFRRGQAFMGTKDWKEAKRDFSAVLLIDSENKTARNQIKIADHHIRLEKEKSKKTYAGMFQKFADQDAKRAVKEDEKVLEEGSAV